ncbi:MAG: cation diffusion facilitator family transporter [Proteobacteria bacterium]|nr:cation diffusion facilitator family transporter [Pseudomonadota bacterium]MBU1612381.1 cation diffusion facilitator family transporter [Pseudomonadota bacterium]
MTFKNSPRIYATYSIAASVATLALKLGAWGITGSVGLLSDAAEGMVNLTAGILALTALNIALRPADQDHSYGHGKAEYFSSGAEGILIIGAACAIVWAAIARFLHPAPLTNLGWGVLIALAASAVNFFTATSMLRAAKRFDSITLEADAKHLLTDVWTSAGLVVGLSILVFAPPSWYVLDPIIAILMALNIIKTGVSLLRRSAEGLMDRALPEDEVNAITEAIRKHVGQEAEFHGLRTRKSGSRRFVDFHLLVPGKMTVKASHDITEAIEAEICRDLPKCLVTIHVEPRECDKSWDGAKIGGICSREECVGCEKNDQEETGGNPVTPGLP